MHATTPAPSPHRSHSSGSLRLRLRAWISVIFAATLALLTGATITEARRQAVTSEQAHAQALLDHLAAMPAFRGRLPAATAQLDAMRGSLEATGARLEIGPAASTGVDSSVSGDGRSSWKILASREVEFEEGTRMLRYRSDPGALDRVSRRAVLLHAAHGLVALAALLIATGWILERHLIGPLAGLSGAIDGMLARGDWTPRLPPTVDELSGLAKTVADLGPGLEEQGRLWIEVERRASVALALTRLRKRIRAPLRRARANVSDVLSRDLARPAGKVKLRALLLDIEEISRAAAEEAAGGFKSGAYQRDAGRASSDPEVSSQGGATCSGY